MSDLPLETFDNFDIQATITGLFVYPIKSCAGVAVQEAILTETGLEFDRAWMVVDDKGAGLLQRGLGGCVQRVEGSLVDDHRVLGQPGLGVDAETSGARRSWCRRRWRRMTGDSRPRRWGQRRRQRQAGDPGKTAGQL